YVKRLEIPMNVEAYIQSIVLKKTVETISFDRRRELEELGKTVNEFIERAYMHEEPTSQLTQASNREYGHPYSGRRNEIRKLTININEESDFEEETMVIQEVEENI
ncbi:hypothetical protein CWI38_2360p0020, partial [Hamiltosporidium tvaerminnensis]